MTHPVQLLYKDEQGIIRFRNNAIVKFLQETSQFDLNTLARMPFSREDWVQFAQLIGYSLSGFGELPYVTDKDYDRAERGIKMNITQYSNAELLAELKRREYQQIDSGKPQAIADPDLTDLRQTCQAYIDAVAMRDYIDDDLPHWIFEAAVIALYGKDVFNWINRSRK